MAPLLLALRVENNVTRGRVRILTLVQAARSVCRNTRFSEQNVIKSFDTLSAQHTRLPVSLVRDGQKKGEQRKRFRQPRVSRFDDGSLTFSWTCFMRWWRSLSVFLSPVLLHIRFNLVAAITSSSFCLLGSQVLVE